MDTSETLLSITKHTCSDINSYYRTSKAPKFIKKHIAMAKYRDLNKAVKRYKENSSFIDKNLFYDFIKDLYLVDDKKKHRYFCNKLIKDSNEAYIFCFTYKLNDLIEKDKHYYSDTYGKITKDDKSFDISYDLISINQKGNKNLIGKYDENTDELLNSLVFFNTHNNSDTTTLSYKIMYNQNYFAKLIFDNLYKYIDRYIKNSMKELENNNYV